MRSRTSRLSLAVAALALVGAACSGDDDSSGETTPGTTGEQPEDTGAPDGTTADTTTDSTAGTTPGEEVQTGESLLDTVIANDVVRCGVRDDLPGFSTLDDAGEHVGFDADFCRVIAAAVLGDATKAEFVDIETEARFTALQSGEIDVLVRNTTWTASRDGVEGATFLHPTFYDGQGMMVASDSGFTSLDDMDGTVICVAAGTTTEGNVATEFARRGLTVEVQSFEGVELIQEAFIAGRCDGWSSDTSQLTGLRSNYPDGPEALTILDEVFSKEPLAPAVVDGDSRWAQAVQWAIYATIQAEELGIDSTNAADMVSDDDLNIQRFLAGVNEDGTTLDTGLGLPPDFNLQVVTQVGNYGEIFEANLAPLGLERGVNALWTDGGLHYAPPYR
ncbi:MAG: amino acid ABC transporter substrate-binding protein [Ilumatobacteraceae bacterium]